MQKRMMEKLMENYHTLVRAKNICPETDDTHGFASIDEGIRELEKVIAIAEEAVRPYLCSTCEGSGSQGYKPCPDCGGTGLRQLDQ